MTSSVITSRYANALADVVTRSSSVAAPQRVVEELRSFEAALESSAELRNALASPAVPPQRKRAVVRRLSEMLELSRISMNFLCVLIDHRRTAALEAIVNAFEVVLEERLGFSRAEVSSARELDERQRALLTAELSHLTGTRIKARFAVDESLIGGVMVRVGSTVYDGSVKGRLQALGRRLAAE